MPRPTTTPTTLRRILQEELQVGKRMIALVEAESAAIVHHNIAQLNALEGELHRCMEQQTALEESRRVVTRELAWSYGEERMLTLAELLPLLPPREQEALKRLRDQLLETEEILQNLNRRNRTLLDHAMEFVRFSLDAITTAVLKPARYGTNLTKLAAPTFYVDSKA